VSFRTESAKCRTSARAVSASGSGTTNQSYSYSYDPDSELTGITSTAGASLSATLGYDNGGRRQSLTAGSVTTAYGYDADSQLTSLSFNSGALGQLGYNYDSDGRVTSESGSLDETVICGTVGFASCRHI
jgi:YD repeat-containing protein